VSSQEKGNFLWKTDDLPGGKRFEVQPLLRLSISDTAKAGCFPRFSFLSRRQNAVTYSGNFQLEVVDQRLEAVFGKPQSMTGE
jgi:hypothetical protein